MKTKGIAYLAGPITGLSYGATTDWREDTKNVLESYGIVAFSPMRHKEHLVGTEEIAQSYDESVVSCDRGIVTRDRFDVARCDVMLINLLGAEKVSIGTMVEFGWADAYRKPIVVVMEERNLHDHPFTRDLAGYIVTTLEQGIDMVRRLLVP